MDDSLKRQALEYHEFPVPGKVSVTPTKSFTNATDLSLAYTPGVAEPCLEIEKNPDDAYRYTSKGNLVAVISNGTAVLGLGDIGAAASKPVMEGKGVLFKRFANIEVFDLEVNEKDPDKFISIVKSLEPTFGGINLEDIKAPECFYIEEELKRQMNIPVFHDDQHGTAVVMAAGLLNALTLTGRTPEKIKVVFSGAGAAAISCATILLELGVKKENIFMFDSQGLISEDRDDELNVYKKMFMQSKDLSLATALMGADVFIGVSKGNVLTAEMIQSMFSRPIVFAMANPVPEIDYKVAKTAVPDIIFATGRSDYPNQINNVLCFPFIFRGALDVRASEINMAMKLAAVKALTYLVNTSDEQGRTLNSEYIIPGLFDQMVLPAVAAAVAQAAIETGVAKKSIDLMEYRESLIELTNKLRV
jgi:malate dehydrogenase (oxaloacetate-decarboxylating)(NADP+)